MIPRPSAGADAAAPVAAVVARGAVAGQAVVVLVTVRPPRGRAVAVEAGSAEVAEAAGKKRSPRSRARASR